MAEKKNNSNKHNNSKAPKAYKRPSSRKENNSKQKSNKFAFSDKKSMPKSYKDTRKKTEKKVSSVKIIPLGGIGEIGKNITLYEFEDDAILVDCGMAFPDEEMPGIDIVIPDFSYIVKNADKIKGLVLTHGHEDHIGAIPYLLKNINLPIYGTRLTLGLVEGKLKEHNLFSGAALNVVKPGDKIKLGKIGVEFIHVNHSIPDAVGVAVSTPAGVIIQTGDFKVDTTPIDGNIIDIARFSELGKKGVLALLADSTNAERHGFTSSERRVGESLSNLFKKADKNRIIVATFSSNIHRIQQIVDEAVRCSRKVAVSGRSMLNVVNVAAELGYLKLPQGVLVDIDSIKKYTPDQIVIITTGSQGEPLSALHRMAFSEHRNVEIVPGDMIIISATPIPGNEKTVSKVINELMKRGATVVYEKMYDVHVSGHACQEELKLMLSITNPKYFIPVHGEEKHLLKHADLAKMMGMPKENIVIAGLGDVIELSSKAIKIPERVTAGRVMVDGLGVGDVGSIVLRDRKHLSDNGIIIVALAMDSSTGEVVSGPDVITRGFVYVKESEEIILDAREAACKAIENCYLNNIRDWNSIKAKIKDSVSKCIFDKTRRTPMVLPIILDV